MKRITRISTTPTTALPAIARSPAVNAYMSAVIAAAPSAGPAQCRVPPRTLISTTVSGTVIENVSPTVTYDTNIA